MRANPSSVQNEKALRDLLSQSSDFKSSEFSSGDRHYRLFYIDTMIEQALVQDHIIRPLQHHSEISIREAVTVLDYSETELLSEAAQALVEGKTVLQTDGEARLILLGTELKKARAVNIPLNERVLRGSNEALIEDLQTNLNLLRKLIASPDLAVKYYDLGTRSHTKVALIYLQSLANKDVIQEFEHRIANISIDYVEAPGFLEELIDDKKFSIFPRILVTERPDRVRSYLMDGKLAVMTEGSPDCLIVPVSFWAFLQSPDDYQIGWLIGSTYRLLRVFCFVLAMCLPGLYVALVTFDPRTLPFEIMLTLQSTLQYVAMPPVLEALTMLLTLEILREATIRLSTANSQAIGIVGGIVIGTVVVQSNLISTMMVVVVAFTALASFLIPTYELRGVVRILTYPFILMASVLGMIGLELSFLLVLAHLSRMSTMGIPYFYSGIGGATIRDTFFRGPIRSLNRAKESLAKDDTRIRGSRRRK